MTNCTFSCIKHVLNVAIYNMSLDVDYRAVLAVFISLSCLEGLCSPFSNGFSTESNLIEQARLIPNFAEIENNTLIFQHMNFTQDGILTNLKFAAVEFGTGNGRNRFPKLQVYEPDAEEGYILRYNISLANATQTDHPHVYKLAVTPLRYIRAGSIVGFFQPPKSEAQFLLSYLRNAGPPAQSAYAMQSSTVEPYPGKEGPLPLVALEISKIMSCHEKWEL